MLGGDVANRMGTALGLLVVMAACGPSSSDTALEITRFETTKCPDGPSESDECYSLRVEVVGSGSDETGSCRVVAVAGDGSDIATETELKDLELESGRTHEFIVKLPKMDSPDFDRWEPTCEPQGEG
jgi:hypothetical protein